jgi:Ca2+-binding EF-hand superfamily protein
MATQGNPHGPARRSVKRVLSGDDVADLQEEFDAADEDGDQRIEFTEFARILDDMGAEMSYEEQRAGFRKADKNHDGAIDFQEFLDWWREL